MNISQVAIQLYTLRDYLKTPQDARETLQKVKEIGYTAVQISGMGPMSTETVRDLVQEAGLTICATHESAALILESPQQVVDILNILGTDYTAYPCPTVKVDLLSPEGVKTWVQQLNDAGKYLYEHGKVLTYHNHHHEFMKSENKLILDIIYNDTDPKYLQGEIDTYWVQVGGGSPVEWCKKLKGRLPLLHLKDYRIGEDRAVKYAPIGSGNLDFPAIIKAAEESGCKWFIVEQDDCYGDPFVSIKSSFDYIKQNLCKS